MAIYKKEYLGKKEKVINEIIGNNYWLIVRRLLITWFLFLLFTSIALMPLIFFLKWN